MRSQKPVTEGDSPLCEQSERPHFNRPTPVHWTSKVRYQTSAREISEQNGPMVHQHKSSRFTAGKGLHRTDHMLEHHAALQPVLCNCGGRRRGRRRFVVTCRLFVPPAISRRAADPGFGATLGTCDFPLQASLTLPRPALMQKR